MQDKYNRAFVAPKKRGVMRNGLIAAIVVMVCGGCSHETWVETKNATALPTLVAPIVGPVYLVAMAGSAITAPDSPEDAVAPDVKKFVHSRQVLNDFSNDGDTMSFILAAQDRFKAKDFGDVPPEQAQKNKGRDGGKGSIGWYARVGKPTLIMVDKGDEVKVTYESEGR